MRVSKYRMSIFVGLESSAQAGLLTVPSVPTINDMQSVRGHRMLTVGSCSDGHHGQALKIMRVVLSVICRRVASREIVMARVWDLFGGVLCSRPVLIGGETSKDFSASENCQMAAPGVC